jgi:hypothetical protein
MNLLCVIDLFGFEKLIQLLDALKTY